MQIISIAAEYLASAIDDVLFLWFLVSYFGEKRKIRWWEYMIWCILLFIPIHFLSEFFNIQSVMILLVMFLFSVFCLKKKAIEKLILCFVLCILTAFINIGIIQLVAILSGSAVEELIVGGSILRIIVLCVSKVTLILALVSVEKVIDRKYYFKREEYIFGGVLYLAFFMVAVIALRIIGTVELSQRDQMSFLILTVLLLGINSFMFWLIRRMNVQNRCELENGILRVQLEQQEKLIRNTEYLYQETRKVRHDMKHYFTTYLQLLRDGETELVMEEMQKMLRTQLDTKNLFYMECKMLNAVINQKASVCREEEISFEVQITGDYRWKNEGNIAVLLSNLLDNAIEAERRQKEKKEITLKIYPYKEIVNMIVENHIAESVLDKNPNLKTTKKDKTGHGIGMKSIREIVRQEEGELDIYEEGERFVIHILLPCHEMEGEQK